MQFAGAVVTQCGVMPRQESAEAPWVDSTKSKEREMGSVWCACQMNVPGSRGEYWKTLATLRPLPAGAPKHLSPYTTWRVAS